MRWLVKERIRLFKGQRGVIIIETLAALAVLGLIGVAFVGGLCTSSRTIMISQQSMTAESLFKSQVEYLKTQDYIPVDQYSTDNCYKPIDIPADLAGQGYDVEIINPPIKIIAAELAPFELQSITVVVKRNGTVVLTVSIYRQGSAPL